MKSIGLVVLTALACFGVYSAILSWQDMRSKENISSDILLERTKKVFKLVTVEGNFTELYNYEHHVFADLWPFRKTALVQVNARVLVGYDFEKVKFEIDDENRILYIKEPLEPAILGIEHDVKSYDFAGGIFNPITDQDITAMSAEAKEFIRTKADQSDLFLRAEEQKDELIDMLHWMLGAADWELRMEPSKVLD